MKTLIALLLMTSAAFAQTKEYAVKLTPEEVNQVYSLLQMQPYKDVAALIAKLQIQITEQNKSAEAKK